MCRALFQLFSCVFSALVFARPSVQSSVHFIDADDIAILIATIVVVVTAAIVARASAAVLSSA